eukprot:935489-Amphidinium_carterae.1
MPCRDFVPFGSVASPARVQSVVGTLDTLPVALMTSKRSYHTSMAVIPQLCSPISYSSSFCKPKRFIKGLKVYESSRILELLTLIVAFLNHW